MADSYHVLTLMKISVIRPIGAPSPSKEAESRRMMIPARAYIGRCQKPIFPPPRTSLTVKVGDIPNR